MKQTAARMVKKGLKTGFKRLLYYAKTRRAKRCLGHLGLQSFLNHGKQIPFKR